MRETEADQARAERDEIDEFIRQQHPRAGESDIRAYQRPPRFAGVDSTGESEQQRILREEQRVVLPDEPSGSSLFREAILAALAAAESDEDTQAVRKRICPDCHGSGWIEEDQARRVRRCRCYRAGKRRRAERAFSRTGLGNGPLPSIDQPPFLSLAESVRGQLRALGSNIAGGPSAGIWIRCALDSERTAACRFIAGEAMRRGGIVEGGRTWEVLASLRRAGHDGGEQQAGRVLDGLASADLLVLGDFDRTWGEGFALERHSWWRPLNSYTGHDLIRLSELVRRRHWAGLPTVVTSSASPTACAAALLPIERDDLALALLAATVGRWPYEDHPSYVEAVLSEVVAELAAEVELVELQFGSVAP